MSSSDQQEQGPLTRKQLREIRMTGSTPVISAEEAAAAAELAVPPAPPLPEAPEPESVPEPEHTSDVAADESGADQSAAPLTRRQARAREGARTGSVPVTEESEADAATGAEQPAEAAPEVEELVQVDEQATDEPVQAAEPVVSGVPDFANSAPVVDEDDDDAVDDVETIVPVSAAAAAESVGDVPVEVAEESTVAADEHDDVSALGLVDARDPDDVLADVDEGDDDTIDAGERPTVNPAFGVGLLNDPAESQKPFTPSFDDLLTVNDSTGSQHLAPSALIFTPSPGEGSLSGPVASTGEILITGSYELPRGMGSQGHAHGTTDGKEVDAVLIDGELPPASSPTPIAASSAVSTIKPAGEVIRTPAPEKGSKLMLILAITAGGLALALAVVLVVAITTNVF
ncbi:hypothetical protein [Microbacterium oxydans]|uniref:Uncharacterized protein n=1 Tax=Microbacterium oxydans TaxID=82380 RepID=A0A0F0L7W5_9MICO|nr:hypothetical protein [Microbacterium oxydans]KJL27646.1 hypothetical protein RS83_02697 [Microbacterium oxydans]